MKKPCNIAKGELTHNGYIRVQRRVNGRKKKVRAHREAWEEAHGPIPSGMFVLHKCDNRRCREPEHLFLGTHQDNADDRQAKGRSAKGEGAGNARLTDAKVRAIKLSPLSDEDAAITWNISKPHVNRIRRGERWAHITV